MQTVFFLLLAAAGASADAVAQRRHFHVDTSAARGALDEVLRRARSAVPIAHATLCEWRDTAAEKAPAVRAALCEWRDNAVENAPAAYAALCGWRDAALEAAPADVQHFAARAQVACASAIAPARGAVAASLDGFGALRRSVAGVYRWPGLLPGNAWAAWASFAGGALCECASLAAAAAAAGLSCVEMGACAAKLAAAEVAARAAQGARYGGDLGVYHATGDRFRRRRRRRLRRKRRRKRRRRRRRRRRHRKSRTRRRRAAAAAARIAGQTVESVCEKRRAGHELALTRVYEAPGLAEHYANLRPERRRRRPIKPLGGDHLLVAIFFLSKHLERRKADP